MTSKLLSVNQIQKPSTSSNEAKILLKPMLKRYPVTDLDKSDEEVVRLNNGKEEKSKKPHRHREKKKIFTANFPSGEARSRSASQRRDQKLTYEIEQLKNVVKIKDTQIEKLIKKITDIYGFNEEFSIENTKLHNQIENLNKKLEIATKSLEEAENKMCETCIELENEKENLTESNKNYQTDIEMLKTLVYRLNVQIERYQDVLRHKTSNELPPELTNAQSTQRANADSPNLESLHWGSVNTHTLAPLLNSYEEMIRDKSDIIQQYENEINRVTGNLKEILEENERLQKEIEDIRKSKDGWREERTRLQAQLDVCRSKAELQTRRGDIAKEKLVEVLRCYEQKIQSQSLDLERMQEAYQRAKAELVSYKNLNQQPETIIDSLKECQKLFEDLKLEHKTDKTRLTTEMDQLKKNSSDLEFQNHKLLEEINNLKIEMKNQTCQIEELNERNSILKKSTLKLKESRDRLKARLRIALQWAHKLDESQQKMKNTWDDVKQLEAIVRHKEAQIRGLHARHTEEVEKLQQKLIQREETVKNILKDRAKTNT